jgi:hypothetical protein
MDPPVPPPFREEVVPPLALHPEPESHGLSGGLSDLDKLLPESPCLALLANVSADLRVHRGLVTHPPSVHVRVVGDGVEHLAGEQLADLLYQVLCTRSSWG